MKKLIEFLIARYNNKHPNKRVKLIDEESVLGALNTELHMYSVLTKKQYRIVDTADFKDLMQCVYQYNRQNVDTIEIVKPTMYRTVKTCSMKVRDLKEHEPDLFENIIAEKLYDVRHEITNRIWNDLGFDVKREETDTEVKLTVTLNIYNDGKKDSDDGVRDAKESNGDASNRS